jgi:hypothetical protein
MSIDVLQIKYDFSEPMELHSFNESLGSFASLYKTHLETTEHNPKEAKLFVKEISKGSIIVELITNATQMSFPEIIIAASASTVIGPLIEYADKATKLFDFSKRLKSTYDYFIGKGKKPDNLTLKECESLKSLINPVLKMPGNNTVIINFNSPNSQINIAKIDNSNASIIEEALGNEITSLTKPVFEIHKNVIFQWRITSKVQGLEKRFSAYKGIVERISNKAFKVGFDASDEVFLKQKMVEDIDFPYRKRFEIDVAVYYKYGHEIDFYKILAVNNIISF